MAHFPVLLRDTINLLCLQPGDKVIDATFGEGGHSREILKKIGPEGWLLGIDADADNIARAKKIPKFNKRVILVNDNFCYLKKIAEKHNFYPVQAILMDLGWASRQFEESGRGFSFLRDEPLDMRYDRKSQISNLKSQINFKSQIQNSKLTASIIVNEWSEAEIGRILREYGEERNWREIARAIVVARQKAPIKTTQDLVNLVLSLKLKVRNSRLHPATKVFQALRIAVNDELNNLRQVLPQAREILAPGGRLAVISFHSLEDRIVKQFFKSQSGKILKIITKKPITPSREEIKANPRSRSAKLRVAEKI